MGVFEKGCLMNSDRKFLYAFGEHVFELETLLQILQNRQNPNNNDAPICRFIWEI